MELVDPRHAQTSRNGSLAYLASTRRACSQRLFDLRQPDAPCYHCLFPEAEDVEDANCATTGVLAPLVGIVGSMQAAETLKLIAGLGHSLSGRLAMLDARDMAWRIVTVPRDPDCPVCGGKD